MTEVTRILHEIGRGEAVAAKKLLPLIYDELRRLAAHRLKAEANEQTLQATALVHEAYLRLVGSDGESQWDGRGHFFAAAAEAMRRILVENARRKKRLKHGGDRRRVDWEETVSLAREHPQDLVDLDEALHKLAAEDPAKAKLVELRFFGGLTMPEVAQTMGISLTTAERYWTYARTWLYAELANRDGSASG